MDNFTFIDLFAGIGGFHLAMSELGGHCVFASEIDEKARKVYKKNFPDTPLFGDINENLDKIPKYFDVLCAGFPCQPFSLAGKQKGFSDETRGTLFYTIEKILNKHKPSYFFLENVKNLKSHDNGKTFQIILSHLEALKYEVNFEIVSPHNFSVNEGGSPQNRERIFIFGKQKKLSKKIDYNLQNYEAPKKKISWNLFNYLDNNVAKRYYIEGESKNYISTWKKLFDLIVKKDGEFPRVVIWGEDLNSYEEMLRKHPDFEKYSNWKKQYLIANVRFYEDYKEIINPWKKEIKNFPPSRKKFEWQAQDAKSFDEIIIQFRQSGIRCKKATYTPTLVALNNTTIIGKYLRKLTPKECAKLQNFPQSFDFGNEKDEEIYKQLGNAVNVSLIKNRFKRFLELN